MAISFVKSRNVVLLVALAGACADADPDDAEHETDAGRDDRADGGAGSRALGNDAATGSRSRPDLPVAADRSAPML